MSFGGYRYGVERYGGSTPLVKRILEALNKARGTALNTERGTAVWAENMAVARALAEAWNTNRRLANQWDPLRMTSLLERWEKFLQLPVLPDDTQAERRARVAQHFLRFGSMPSRQTLVDKLTEALGSVFVDLITIPLAEAVQWWPGGTPNSDAPWYSTTCHLLVKTQKPSGYTEGDYLEAIAKIHPLLDAIVPAWVTFDYYRNTAGHAAGSFSQDSAAGFYLDDDYNIDYEIFDA